MIQEANIDNMYFEWLYSQIGSLRNRNPARSHWQLAKKFYTTKFFWSVPNDDNRVADGLELRLDFIREVHYGEPERAWLDLECSVLEMLIALSRRVAFETEEQPGDWFWRLVENLELSRYTDDIYEISIDEEVEEVLDRLINRTYGRDGSGGLFPLRDSLVDQRRIEIWNQMSAYLLESEYIDNGPRI